MYYLKRDKRGQNLGLAALPAIAITMVIAIVVMSLGSNVNEDLGDDFTAGSGARNASDNGQAGLEKISSKFGTIGTVVAFVIILGLLGGLVAFSRRQ